MAVDAGSPAMRAARSPWLFTTVVRANLEFAALPWTNAGLSGWILDSDHKKMSKSKGNVVTPMGILEKYGSDAVRYWAASARLGLDAAFEETQIKIGRRLAIKVLNASKFALSMGIPWDADEATAAAAAAAGSCPGPAAARWGARHWPRRCVHLLDGGRAVPTRGSCPAVPSAPVRRRTGGGPRPRRWPAR